MKAIKIALMLVLAIAMVSTALALPITVDKVEVDDVELSPNAVNRFDVLRGDKIEVEVVFTPSADINDMEIQAFFSGDEHNDVAPAFDVTPTFDADNGVTYRKKLSIDIHDFFEEDDYKLRLIFSDRNGAELIQSYNIKIDVPRHGMMIRDVIFNPSGHVKAGSALLSIVRLRNIGEKEENDVKVTVSIPQLGVSASDYVDEIENNDDEEETEELYLRIPRCAKPGVYDIEVEVGFDDGFRKERANSRIEVTADETCEDGAVTGSVKGKTTITIGSQLENVAQGGTAIFPLTLTNAGRTSRSYTLSVQAGDWADVKVSPTSTIVLDGGKTQTLYAFVTASKDAPIGAQVLTATVSSSGQTLEDITLTANIAKGGKSVLRTLLEWFLIVLVVLLVILGLIIGFSRLKGDDDENTTAQPQAYY
jgi:lipoprotein-anchoring transpeptidase ErfK/SrfK